MWRIFEFGLREIFGGNLNLDLEWVKKTPEFCYDLIYIWSLNHIQIKIRHELIMISENKVHDQNWKMWGAWQIWTWTVAYGGVFSLKINSWTQWQWYLACMINKIQILHFPSKMNMHGQMIIWVNFMQCNVGFGKYRS